METKNIIFIIIFFAAVGFFSFSISRIISYIKIGQKDNRFDRIGKRIKNVIVIAFGQSKLLREPAAGILHVFIFWGFVLFIFAVLEAVIQGFYSNFTFEFLGPLFSLITIVQDIFGLLVLSAILFSFYRRYIQKLQRLQVDKHGQIDAAVILLMIFFVVLSMFGQNISHIAKNNFLLTEYEIRPISDILSNYFYSNSNQYADLLYEIFWWMHIILVLGFLNFLPYSKHFHVITSIPNVFFGKLDDEKGALKSLNLSDESIDWYGADDVEKLTWKQILDSYTCTECGRCTSVCPANIVGKTLSPRKIIIDIKKRTIDKAPLLLRYVNEGELIEKTLVHNYISDKELWQCTTCSACVQECPVMIEHVDAIVDMRRHLVLSESNFPSTLNPVFKNLENNSSPWAFNQSERADWAEGMGIKTLSEDNSGEILFWVGCAGSFDERYKKVTRAFASLLQKADIDFRILGVEEKCTGDTARRLGNEYLAQQLIQENVETLNNYGVKKIVTACPHCFNSIKREFKQFGGNYQVVHHSQFINQLLNDGKIKLKETINNSKLTYHDSCYLGRYNEIYNQPRNILKMIKSYDLVEMGRNKSRGLCCGAGGGQMFLEDDEAGRINLERTREAVNSGASTIASACPFCMTMLNDGIKTLEKIENINVKDIAEIVLENSY